MRKLLVLALVLGLAGVAAAADLGNQAPAKVPGVYPINVPNPVRQGGDTVANATVIPSLPYSDTGTTAGYTHDYTATCFSNATAPDVVYRLVVPAGLTHVRISLCGSQYDTGLIIYDASMTQVGCNDDFCSLQSEIVSQPVTAGATYFIVVSGYSAASGAYTLAVEPPAPPCVLTCPAGGYPEGEPALQDNYVDRYNGGCNTSPGFPFKTLQAAEGTGNLTLCGRSGWYLNAGTETRDTDWYIVPVGATGLVEIVADAEYAVYIFELSPQDCPTVAVAQQATAGPCTEAFMTLTGAPNSTKWFWVGPTVFASPDDTTEFDYTIWFSGMPVATESTTWSNVKALY